MNYLETERIILRPFQEGDVDDIFAYASIPGVGERAGWIHHKNKEESRAILYKVFLPNKDDFAIVNKKTNQVIGSFGLHTSTRNASDFPGQIVKELGYVLAKDYWGQGLMTEILTHAIFKWRNEEKADILTANVFTDNQASIHVLEKCGFMHYKIIQDIYFPVLDKKINEDCFYLRLLK